MASVVAHWGGWARAKIWRILNFAVLTWERDGNSNDDDAFFIESQVFSLSPPYASLHFPLLCEITKPNKTCRISFLLPVDEEYFPYGLNPSTDLSDGGSISHRWMILLIWLSFFSPAARRWNFSFDWGKFPFEGVQTTLPGHSNLPVLKICQFTSEINNNCKILRSFCGADQAHNAQVCTWFVFLTWLVATLAGDMFGKSSSGKSS